MSLYDASVPVFIQLLNAMSGCLDKASAFCEAKKVDPSVLVQARLYPDMFALARQVQIATDNAKGANARLAGVEVPSYADTEASIPELKARIQKTVDYLKTFKREQFADAETRDIVLKIGPNTMNWKGAYYLHHFAFPNFMFHAATAYAILRHNGVELGKRDFMGG